jgi:hypothetical protein
MHSTAFIPPPIVGGVNAVSAAVFANASNAGFVGAVSIAVANPVIEPFACAPY